VADAVVLRAGDLDAEWLPGAGMVCSSLRHRGEQLLGQRGGVERYVRERGTMGVPLLHPWANRLSERRFEVAGGEVVVDRAAEHVAPDPNGLPIHGLLAGHPGWEVLERAEARLTARLDFAAHADLLAAFPFPHELTIAVDLDGGGMAVETTLRATGDRAVPVSFGFHPYFVLPGVPRAEWEVELPVGDHLVVDGRMIPTGEREPARGVEPGPLGERTFDDGYAPIAQGARFALSGGGRRVEVEFARGYPVAVVYAPDDDDVVCFEPMTAPTNALVSGDGLRTVEPADAFAARFVVSVSG
jgi:galactose mutarotase-like enzyme